VKIITVDLGTTTGWCVGDPAEIGPVPDWGCWRLAGTKDLNRSFLGLYNELGALVDRVRPRYVVYETPLTQSSRDSSRNVIDLHVGLAAVVRLTCLLCQVPPYEEAFATVRRLVIGRGGFPRPYRGNGKISPRTGKIVGDAKEEVRLWTESYGWGGIDDPDGRDAAVLYRYAQMISVKQQRAA
jgi:hypothetical protein